MGSPDREKFSVKLMSCRAEADGPLDRAEAENNEDDKAKRVCPVVVVLI